MLQVISAICLLKKKTTEQQKNKYNLIGKGRLIIFL